MKRLFASIAASGALLLMAIPAQADGAGAVSFTTTFHNATQVFTPPAPQAFNPCTGAPGTLTITYNGVFHVNVLTSGVGAGTGWDTFTATGSATFAQTNGVTYTGSFTVWDGASANLQNFAATSILVGHLTGSDGSTLDFHDVMHITVLLPPPPTPPTVVMSFDKLTCG